jgi:hypothetical protein
MKNKKIAPKEKALLEKSSTPKRDNTKKKPANAKTNTADFITSFKLKKPIITP